MDCKNGHGLKREKIGPTFLSFNVLSAKMTKTIIVMVSGLFHKSTVTVVH